MALKLQTIEDGWIETSVLQRIVQKEVFENNTC